MYHHLQNHALCYAAFLCPFIVPYCPSVSTRRSNCPVKSKNQNVSVAGIELWNSLPLGVWSANSLGAFCKLLKSLFFTAFPDQ